MNEQKFTDMLLSAGARREDLAQVDFQKITSIVENSSSVDDLCKTLKASYPDFYEEEFRKAVAENMKESEKTEELSDSDLEAVAGGSVGSWLKKNQDWLVPVGVIAGMCIVMPLTIKTINKYDDKNGNARIDKYCQEQNVFAKSQGISGRFVNKGGKVVFEN